MSSNEKLGMILLDLVRTLYSKNRSSNVLRSQSDIQILRFLDQGGKHHCGSLHEQFPIRSVSFLSTTTSRLWQDGLIEKKIDKANQRNKLLIITDKGRALLEQQGSNALLRAIDSVEITDAELKCCEDVLSRLVSALSKV